MRTWHTFPWRKSDGERERRGRRDRAKAFLSRRTIGKRSTIPSSLSLGSIPRDVKRGVSDEKGHALVIVERERPDNAIYRGTYPIRIRFASSIVDLRSRRRGEPQR